MEDMEAILSRQISGFHRYCLSEPVHLTYVSQNLCDMLGLGEQQLLEGREDRYARLVHPGDRERYQQFLQRLAKEQGSGAIQYRLIKPDGMVLSVHDTIYTSIEPDGTLMGSSVLGEITELQSEIDDLRFLNQTIPCGFLKYTCDKQPKITYLSDNMLNILGFPGDQAERKELLELYSENLYSLIPMEERRRIANYLERVAHSSVPLAGEMSVLRCDGTKAHLFGWVVKSVDDRGKPEFRSVCMDISQRHHIQKAAEINRYLSALHDVYDKIFRYDFTAGTVTCLYGQNSAMFKWLEHIPMQMQEATEKWVNDTVYPEDQQKVLTFFRDFFRHREDQPLQIRYRARSSDGRWKRYMGQFLEIDRTVSLFCCRNLGSFRDSEDLWAENVSLKNINENMQELMMQFTDGIAGFEISGDLVTPLYASDTVCDFFGFTREEWMELMKQKTPTAQFVRHSGIPYEELARVLTQGEAEFTFPDPSTGQMRRIKAICSRKSPDGTEPCYVMLYDLTDGMQVNRPKIYIRTFGFFDVFVDEKPIAFRIQKAKELFALLVDRRGGFVTSDEAISYLWPEEPSNAVTLARYRKVALRMKSILEEYGISDVVESVDGKRRLVTSLVSCDLYDYLEKPENSQLFKGSYLSNYSWGETTLGELTCKNLY